MLAKIPQFRGLSPWILMDFRSPMRQLPGIQDGFNRKGLISDQGQKKQAFFVLQSKYRQWEQVWRDERYHQFNALIFSFSPEKDCRCWRLPKAGVLLRMLRS